MARLNGAWLTHLAVAGFALAAPTARADHRASPPDMKAHFADVTAVHEAVIRGDLDGVRKAATTLGGRSFEGLPPAAATHVAALKIEAGRVAAAADLTSAAMSASSMVAECGVCHRAVGAVPVPATAVRPGVGQTVGHMLDHQRALDDLLQGLVIPSGTSWNKGAQTLRTAPLSPGKLPKDPKLTGEIAAKERLVHQLADEAAGSSDTPARVAVYGQLLAACAGCHSLHANIWGPSRN